jgi:cell division septal protein FtsQ
MPVAAPTDRRFRRAQVSPARRRTLFLSWRKAGPSALLAACALYGGYRLVGVALSTEALAVSHIEITGTHRLSQGEVLALLDGLEGESMVTLDLERWRQKVMASPWVADVSVRRVLPRTVTVGVSERKPMAIARMRERLYLVDARGQVIDEFGPNYADFDLPIIDGLRPSDAGSAPADEARAILLWRLLSALESRQDLGRRLSQIDVSDARDAAIVLKDDTALVRLGDDQFVRRLETYLDLVPALRERIPDIDYVDLRFDERIYVRPRAARARGPAPGERN